MYLSEPIRSGNSFQKPLVVVGKEFAVFRGMHGLVSAASEVASTLPKAPTPAQFEEPTPVRQGLQWPRSIT